MKDFIIFLFLLFLLLPIILGLWSIVLSLLRIVFDEYGIDFTNLFNRKEVDIPDFVKQHSNSEIEYLFKERRKNDK